MCYWKPGPRCHPASVLRMRQAIIRLEKILERHGKNAGRGDGNLRVQRARYIIAQEIKQAARDQVSSPASLLRAGSIVKEFPEIWEKERKRREEAQEAYNAWRRQRRADLKEGVVEPEPWKKPHTAYEDSVFTIDKENTVPMVGIAPRFQQAQAQELMTAKEDEKLANFIASPSIYVGTLEMVAMKTTNEELRVLAVRRMGEMAPDSARTKKFKEVLAKRREAIRKAAEEKAQEATSS